MKFGPHTILPQTIFLRTKYCFAFTNLRPSVDGHCLVSPKRIVPFFDDLNDEEKLDLISTAKRVASVLQKGYGTDGIGITMQDGPAAGQTVPHVHFHVIPRNFPTKWRSSPNLSIEVQEENTKKVIEFFKKYDPEYVEGQEL